ncbi:peroxisomal leader peptide-processing protease-like [Amphiura filiformis]|uniref:peroxisomal leader peptide-processing protease-like n=1 Tax=Amphiura filiformis TaxID=82378 RepID=UPI003B20CC0B
MEETFMDNCVVHVNKPTNTNYSASSRHTTNAKSTANEPIDLSCSGVLIHPSKGLVLTSGIVFTEFVKHRPRIYSQFATKPYRHHWFEPGGTTPKNIRYYSPKDLDFFKVEIGVAKRNHAKTRNSSKTFTVFDAELIVLWKCEDLAEEIQRLFPANDNWRFAEEVPGHDGKPSQRGKTTKTWDDDKHLVEPVGMSSLTKDDTVENFVSWMAMLKIKNMDDWVTKIRKPLLHSSSSLHQGDPLYLCGTPFGSMCPSVFLNSVSKGIVTNTSGPGNAMIITDARCMPGSEGGGVYIIPRNESPRKRRLVGMIVAPLCWKANEWIGLSLACSIQSVLDSLRALVHWDGNSEPIVYEDTIVRGSHMSNIEQSMHGVVLVRVGAVWGSGVILERSEGIIVTCYHVIKNAKKNKVQVRVDHPHQQWLSAEVIFAAGPHSTYDLAFLKLQNSENKTVLHGLPSACMQHYRKGAPVYVVGHALIGPSTTMLPSVTSGVMSKVITIGHQPVMLQSTCAVHSGASGGALVCANTGALLGIISSNSRDTDTGASFPHVNFSISMTVIQPVLQQYLSNKDSSVFHELSRHDSEVKALWRLEETSNTRRAEEDKSKL